MTQDYTKEKAEYMAIVHKLAGLEEVDSQFLIELIQEAYSLGIKHSMAIIDSRLLEQERSLIGPDGHQ